MSLYWMLSLRHNWQTRDIPSNPSSSMKNGLQDNPSHVELYDIPHALADLSLMRDEGIGAPSLICLRLVSYSRFLSEGCNPLQISGNSRQYILSSPKSSYPSCLLQAKTDREILQILVMPFLCF